MKKKSKEIRLKENKIPKKIRSNKVWSKLFPPPKKGALVRCRDRRFKKGFVEGRLIGYYWNGRSISRENIMKWNISDYLLQIRYLATNPFNLWSIEKRVETLIGIRKV